MVTEDQSENYEISEQPKQIFDMDNGKYIDNPMLKVSPKDDPEEEEEEAEEVEEKTTPKAKKASKEEESPESESEEEEEEAEEAETEENEEESEPEEESEEEEPAEENDDITTPDAYVEHFYGEKYGVKTEKELTDLIDSAVGLQDEHAALVKERDTLKAEAGKPKFKSDKEQKAFDFISQFDVDRQGEALDTYAKLISMDVETADPMLVLEEKFVHEHPEWTRAESQRMFKKEYAKKYTLKRESFDGTDEEFAQEQADLKIMEKGEVARAKNYLKDQKAKYKPSEKEAPKANEAVTEAVKKNTSQYADYAAKAKELVFEDDGEKYIFKLDAEKNKQVSAAMDAWVKNPANYNEKGELNGINSPQEMLDAIVGGMFMKDIVKSLKSQIKNVANTKRVDEIAKNTPKKRQTPGGSDTKNTGDDLGEQARRLIRNRKAA